MRIPLLTYGSRGDVQPFLALAQGLQKAGHTPLVAAPERLGELAQAAGVPFHPLPGDPADFARAIIDQTGNNPWRIWKYGREFTFGLASQVIREMRAACQGADLIVHTFLMTTGGHALAREMRVPDISAQFFPVFAPTGDFAALILPAWRLGRAYNRLTHRLFTFFFWRLGHLGYGGIARRDPALPQRIYWPFEKNNPWVTPQLFGFSPLLVAQPKDWTARQHVTGFWQLEDGATDWQPPAELAAFLARGDAPLCVSFGSVVSEKAERIYAEVLEAVRLCGQRAVILRGWSGWGPESLPPEILLLDSAPHDWLLPRCSAVIHHAGAGASAAALRSGRPNLGVPFAADQPFWARRLEILGVSPPPIPAKKLRADRLARAIRQMLEDSAMRACAAQTGAQVRREDGVGQAVRLIEAYAQEWKA